ncbi:protein neuralized-like isoform X2 [Babylonia areolata]|uniref:protein neuralized-like isoform X2 n=1 Tax=Babylonia areolata TaxID=304850 RepID=UPI003FD60B5D
MGNNSSTHGRGGVIGDLNSLRSDRPLQFHDTHGDNIALSHNKTRARRAESFCKGICFSNRPIAINEKVYIRFVETNTSWSGVLRFGFTSVDPATIRGSDLPRYACPDLTNKPGNWAKALGERYTTNNIVLYFYTISSGDVYYGVNGEEKGLFFSGVNTSVPLWAMLDIYGNTVGVEFTQPNGNNVYNVTEAVVPHSAPISVEQELFSFATSVSMNEAVSSAPMIRYHAGATFAPIVLHTLRGRNVCISSDRTIAVRVREEYCNGYIFTSRPVTPGQKIVLQILGVDRSYIGGLGLGLTACDPDTITPAQLPDDADLLLDRPEYWVVNKDVCRNPEVGDELSFAITGEGEVLYSRNNGKFSVLMHVDRTLPLWAFFDVYGNVQKVKVIGTTVLGSPHAPQMVRSQSTSGYGCGNLSVVLPPPAQAPPPQPRQAPAALPSGVQPQVLRSISAPGHPPQSPPPTASPTSRNHPSSVPVSPSGVGGGGGFEEARDECTVCCEKPVNCVLYTCGHMCMCFECATAVQHNKGGLCPICRQVIRDVIRIYRS